MLTILGVIGLALLAWRLFVSPVTRAHRMRRLERRIDDLERWRRDRWPADPWGGGGGERSNVVTLRRFHDGRR